MARPAKDKKWIVEGNAWRVGDNVNTESITPSTWLHAGGELLMQHIGELLIPDVPNRVGILSCSNRPKIPTFRGVPPFFRDCLFLFSQRSPLLRGYSPCLSPRSSLVILRFASCLIASPPAILSPQGAADVYYAEAANSSWRNTKLEG